MLSEAHNLDKQPVPFLIGRPESRQGCFIGGFISTLVLLHRAASPGLVSHKSFLETVSPPPRQTLSPELLSPRWYP